MEFSFGKNQLEKSVDKNQLEKISWKKSVSDNTMMSECAHCVTFSEKQEDMVLGKTGSL